MFKGFLIGFLALTGVCFGALVEGDRAVVDLAKNILVNPGFESGKATVSVTGGTLVANSTAKAFGALGLSWDSNGAAQILSTAQVTVPEGLKTNNALATCSFKAASGVATHKFQVYDGSTVLAETDVISSTTGFVNTSINFVAPSSGTLGYRVVSVAADEPALYMDNCLIGLARNLQLANQAVLVGTAKWASTTNCVWSTSSTSMANFAADTDCPNPTVTGALSAPGTKIPGAVLSPAPPGEYLVMATFTGGRSGANSAGNSYDLSDGTLTSNPVSYYTNTSVHYAPFSLNGNFSVATAQSSITYQVRGASGSGGNSTELHNANNGNTPFTGLEIKVYRFPTSRELALTPSLQSGVFSGYHDSTCSFAVTNAAFTDFGTDATCAFTTSVNANFGTIVSQESGGNKLPGIVITPKTPKTFDVCADMTIASSLGQGSVRMMSGATVVHPGREFKAPSGNETSVTLCGLVQATSTADVTVRLQAKASSGSMTLTSAASSAVNWRVMDVTQSIPVPLFVGSVSSSSTGSERIERATMSSVCTTGTCALATSTPGISSITFSSTGTYTVNFAAGTFSSGPTCVASTALNGGAANGNCAFGTPVPSTSLATVECRALTTSALQNDAASVICMGPK